ncbi:hypothetical protein SMSP2_02365 [Limihaloglobus sulfuriphilus]|uniref:ATP-binding protein n=1 Tax=Limihaloglobus sulfuriphilus TaxID=1851148 RepID=A0A1R7T5Y4_9BACT|nr:ATP-binding protein [Limihaloglobus sulfuriphilus]AQQ71986.1 hypothetical protein SMSP2_02365 [Limihaloglobus sulfuriphilus]
MSYKYVKRTIEPQLCRAAKEFPAVVLTGPRQSGKTTVIKEVFGHDYKYVSMELPDIRIIAENDPRGFLAEFSGRVIFDEIQYCPVLLPYIKELIDSDRQTKGRFILTGSQNLMLTENINESLAGRAAILKLYPFSLREYSHAGSSPFPWEQGYDPEQKKVPEENLWQFLLRGLYPEIATDTHRSSSLWHSSYISTYIERDVRLIKHVSDLGNFQVFLQALAIRNGQLLNLSEISRDIGVAVNTVKNWLSVLEATFQIVILRPYFENAGKRIVKSPKVYFTDIGTLCSLTGISDPVHLQKGPMGGSVFETCVIMELVKTFSSRAEPPKIYFWRTSAGDEVDIVVIHENKLIPIEIKLSSTPKISMARGINVLKEALPDKCLNGYVVYPGSLRLPLGSGTTAVPLRAF